MRCIGTTMNITHVINHTFRHNGNVHAAIDLACAQAKLGHSIKVFRGGGDFDEILKDHNIQIVELKRGRAISSLLQNVMMLRAELKQGGAQIFHAHMMQSAVIAWLASLGRPMLVTSVHNAFQKSSILMALGDRVIAVSGAIGEQLRKRGVPASKLRVVLNGTVGSARYPTDLPRLEKLERPSFLYVGGLHPRKGVLDLIGAMSIARISRPDFHLYVVGEGPMEMEYKQAVPAADKAHIHFVGSRADPRGFLASADVFVLASHADPAPLVISEAREAGLAVIGTQVDGIPELLDNGRAGYLVPPQNPAALAEALLTVGASDESIAQYRSASQSNINGMSLERVAKETLAIYSELGCS
jgi:glycosyltransferase involved in cell wall biosynthesis